MMTMTRLFLVLGLTAAFFLGMNSKAWAQENTQAKSVSVKIGYFNLPLVKASYQPASNAEILKAQAEAMLREELKTLNEALSKMQTEKKAEAEIAKFKELAQTKISAKQQAYTEILANQTNQVKVSIAKAVDTVARAKGLDIVLDGQGLFAGGKLVLDNGVDITKEVVAQLSPASKLQGSRPQAQTSAPKAASASEQ